MSVCSRSTGKAATSNQRNLRGIMREPAVRRVEGCRQGRNEECLASKEPAEQPLAGLGIMPGAAIPGRNGAHDRVDVLAAASPRGFSAVLAGDLAAHKDAPFWPKPSG